MHAALSKRGCRAKTVWQDNEGGFNRVGDAVSRQRSIAIDAGATDKVAERPRYNAGR